MCKEECNKIDMSVLSNILAMTDNSVVELYPKAETPEAGFQKILDQVKTSLEGQVEESLINAICADITVNYMALQNAVFWELGRTIRSIAVVGGVDLKANAELLQYKSKAAVEKYNNTVAVINKAADAVAEQKINEE